MSSINCNISERKHKKQLGAICRRQKGFDWWHLQEFFGGKQEAGMQIMFWKLKTLRSFTPVQCMSGRRKTLSVGLCLLLCTLLPWSKKLLWIQRAYSLQVKLLCLGISPARLDQTLAILVPVPLRTTTIACYPSLPLEHNYPLPSFRRSREAMHADPPTI